MTSELPTFEGKNSGLWDGSLAPDHVQAVLIARAQATAYVWGRQDAGESPRDTGYSIEFGEWYAAMKRAFLEERIWSMPTVEGAFLEWKEARNA